MAKARKQTEQKEVKTLPSAETLLEASKNTYGWLSEVEATQLYQLAKDTPKKKGVIVEVGSFVGKSLLAVVAGAIEAGNTPVFSIDTHEGSPEHNTPSNPYFSLELNRVNTLPHLEETLTKAEVRDSVEIKVGDGVNEGQNWQQQNVGFIFIDTAHDYDTTYKTIEAWAGKVVKDGVIAVHDYVPFAQAVDDFLASHPNFKRIAVIDTMLVMVKEK